MDKRNYEYFRLIRVLRSKGIMPKSNLENANTSFINSAWQKLLGKDRALDGLEGHLFQGRRGLQILERRHTK
jgi:hypothetical protein